MSRTKIQQFWMAAWHLIPQTRREAEDVRNILNKNIDFYILKITFFTFISLK